MGLEKSRVGVRSQMRVTFGEHFAVHWPEDSGIGTVEIGGT